VAASHHVPVRRYCRLIYCHVAPSQRNNKLGYRRGVLGGEEQVYMVGHERIGVQ